MFSKQRFINSLFPFLILLTFWSCAEPTPEEKKATETARLIKILNDSTTVPSLQFYSYKDYTVKNDSFSFVELEKYKVKPPSIAHLENDLYTIIFPYIEKDSVFYYSVVGKFLYCANSGYSEVRKKTIRFVFEIQDPKNWIEYARVSISLKPQGAVMGGLVFKDSNSFGMSIGEDQHYAFNKK